MPQQIPNVRTWSKTVSPYAFNVADLDVYVLKEQQEIVRAMGRCRETKGDPVEVVLVLLGIVLPVVATVIWGESTYRGREIGGLDADVSTPLSAGCFALTCLLPPLVAWRWWRCRRHRDAFELGCLVAVIVTGGLVLGAMSDDGEVDVLGLEPASIPVWLAVVLSLLVVVVVAVGSRGKRTEFGNYFRVVAPADTDRVRLLVGGLEPGRHEKLLDERRRAIGRLRDRGLLDERQVAEVASLPLGWSPTLGS